MSDPLPFIFYFDQQTDFTIPACSSVTFNLQANNATGAKPPAPPYTAIFYPIGGQPLVIPVPGGSQATTSLAWRAALPARTQIFFQFVDSAGTSGGTGSLYTITNSRDNCASTLSTTSPISLSLNPASNPQTCQEVDLQVQGGTAPYTFSIVRQSFTNVNQTSNSAEYKWANTVTAGGSMSFVVSDSTGVYSVTSPLSFSQGGSDTSCLTNNPPNNNNNSNPSSRSSNTGTLIGAILGSVIGVLLLALIVLAFLYRRRVKQFRDAGEPAPRGFEILRRPRRTSDRSYRSTDKFAEYGNDPPTYQDEPGTGAGRRGRDDGSVYSMQNIEPMRTFRITNPDAESTNGDADDDRRSTRRGMSVTQEDGVDSDEVLRDGSEEGHRDAAAAVGRQTSARSRRGPPAYS